MTDQVVTQAVSMWESDAVSSFEKEGGGGKAWVSFVEIVFGYKVYAQGVTNAESFFKFDVSVQAEREAARLKAGEFAKEKQAKPPVASIAFIIPKGNTYLKNTDGWQEDRWYILPTYSKGYEEVLKPSLKDQNATLGQQWVQVGWKPDPFKPEREGQDPITGEAKMYPNLVPYVLHKFNNKDEAMKVVEEAMVSSDAPAQVPGLGTPVVAAPVSGDYPTGWTKETWDAVIPDLKAVVAKGTPMPEVATMFGVSVADVAKAVAQ